VKLRHIPYRGSAPALQGLLAGDVDLMFDNLGVSLALVEAGKLKLLAVASPNRLPALPDVPTMAETLPGFEAVAWFWHRGAARDPKEHRRHHQCRRQRSPAPARIAESPPEIIR
jgi:tripartite-type tricarboxylate transporter receptor subunit TctC